MRFLEVIGSWINRHFSHEEAIYLVVFLVSGFALLVIFGGTLAPVLTGLVVAFLLQGLVKKLTSWRVPESVAVYLSFVFFLGGLIALLLFVVPLVWQQLSALRAALRCSSNWDTSGGISESEFRSWPTSRVRSNPNSESR